MYLLLNKKRGIEFLYNFSGEKSCVSCVLILKLKVKLCAQIHYNEIDNKKNLPLLPSNQNNNKLSHTLLFYHGNSLPFDVFVVSFFLEIWLGKNVLCWKLQGYFFCCAVLFTIFVPMAQQSQQQYIINMDTIYIL